MKNKILIIVIALIIIVIAGFIIYFLNPIEKIDQAGIKYSVENPDGKVSYLYTPIFVLDNNSVKDLAIKALNSSDYTFGKVTKGKYGPADNVRDVWEVSFRCKDETPFPCGGIEIIDESARNITFAYYN